MSAEGFDEDARRSEIAERFAERAMERDQVVREDARAASDAAATTRSTTSIAIPMFVADELTGVVVCADRARRLRRLRRRGPPRAGRQRRAALRNTRAARRSSATPSWPPSSMLAEAVQAKDPFLRGHSEDVADYVEAISRELGLEEPDREH